MLGGKTVLLVAACASLPTAALFSFTSVSSPAMHHRYQTPHTTIVAAAPDDLHADAPPRRATSLVEKIFQQLYPPGSGMRIKFGVFMENVDKGSVPDAPEQNSRREAAAASLTNIDQLERGNRAKLGRALAVVTIGEQGSWTGMGLWRRQSSWSS
jgi:hypothetical protein